MPAPKRLGSAAMQRALSSLRRVPGKGSRQSSFQERYVPGGMTMPSPGRTRGEIDAETDWAGREADLSRARLMTTAADEQRRMVSPDYQRLQGRLDTQEADYDLTMREPGRAKTRRAISTADALENLHKVLRPTQELGLEMGGRANAQKNAQATRYAEDDAFSELYNPSRQDLGQQKHDRTLEVMGMKDSWRLPAAELAAGLKAGSQQSGDAMIENVIGRAKELSRILNQSSGPAGILQGYIRQAQGGMGTDDAQREYDRLRQPLGVLLATKYQGSRPTDRDAEAFRDLIPKAQDSSSLTDSFWSTLDKQAQSLAQARSGNAATSPSTAPERFSVDEIVEDEAGNRFQVTGYDEAGEPIYRPLSR